MSNAKRPSSKRRTALAAPKRNDSGFYLRRVEATAEAATDLIQAVLMAGSEIPTRPALANRVD